MDKETKEYISVDLAIKDAEIEYDMQGILYESHEILTKLRQKYFYKKSDGA